ncbi:TetR/AcrR family transcriptional regulator [Microbacterium sp. CFH 90308]|uniref:TetR/AcrR family transcriptional regulator n=1 Tax=Microbacterium salsuginis TaxID=2722803 RepID=A0ABX1KB30_9MICO|nr:TetR/AcrR family transcriptional regulator [Microbacterium sp. CFH 90308]NLP84238.1 TetR/AcrR family transcriptional regulator [Microbacterium sp. CFH 90308]
MPTPERTTLPEIVAAGRELLEKGGAAGLTMQAVAERVGVRAPSLYKRVRDRDALVLLVAEATADELTGRLAASGLDIAGLARVYRAFAHEHPEGFRLLYAIDGASESLGRAAGPVLDATRGLVGEEHALEAARLVVAWATGFINMELAGAFRLGGDVDNAFEYGLERLEAGLRA